MPRFLKKFEINWSHLDANRHVANYSFAMFMNDTRMSFIREQGFTQNEFEKYKIGPVVFSEEFHYLKEVMPAEIIQVDVELLGKTEDYKFMQFSHSLFNSKEELAVYSEIYFSWFDLVNRKLMTPPDELARVFDKMERSPRYTLLDRSALKMSDKVPVHKKLQNV